MCAQRLTWEEPSETTITQVEISRSSTIYGTYTVIATIDATDDGEAKTSANSWVITYTDSSGTRTNWYKIRFYDGTSELYSEYSDPITAEELLRLCTVADVKEVINTVGRWTDDEIFKAITQVDDFIYIESGTPVQAIWTEVGKIDNTVQTRYYVGEENIYRVDRVFYGTTTKTELFLDDEYKTNVRYGMIEVLPYASSGVTLTTEYDVEIQYVPDIYHKLSLYRSCKYLLEQIDYTSGGTTSKELDVIEKRLVLVETILAHRVGVQLSSDVRFYDGIYGVNRRHIVQSFERNKYISEYGWD